MRTLTIIRHAKSSWKDVELADFERPLNKRGKRDAPLAGQRLREQRIIPNLIITSPAKRALTTAKAIAKEIGYSIKDLVADRRVYMADVDDLLQMLRAVDNSYKHVAIVGHNPDLTDLANEITGEAIDNVPTCGVVHAKLELKSWQDLDAGTAELILFDYPKKHQ